MLQFVNTYQPSHKYCTDVTCLGLTLDFLIISNCQNRKIVTTLTNLNKYSQQTILSANV